VDTKRGILFIYYFEEEIIKLQICNCGSINSSLGDQIMIHVEDVLELACNGYEYYFL